MTPLTIFLRIKLMVFLPLEPGNLFCYGEHLYDKIPISIYKEK